MQLLRQYGLGFMEYKLLRVFCSKVSHLAKSLSLLPFLLMVAATGPSFADPFRIVGFGDSLMAGYQLEAGAGFTDRLEQVLKERGYEVNVANAAVSGDTTSGGLSRLDWSVSDDADLVILELGANDMLRGIKPEVTERNLEQMIQRLKERNIRILLVGMYAAPNLGAEFIDRFDAIYPRLAEKHDLPLVPFFLEGVITNASLMLEDGMHPNAEGVQRMVETVLPAVAAIVEQETKNM